MAHAMTKIAQGAATLVGTDKEKEEKARVIRSDESIGYWFAESISHELAGQFRGWLSYVAKAYTMTPKARAAATSRLASIIAEMRDHVKSMPEGHDRERARKAAASAVVMLSNFRKVLRAFSAGMEIQLRRDEQGFLLHDRNGHVQPLDNMTTIVADAGLWLETHASNGEEKEEKRGRKVTPWLDYLKKVVERRDAGDKTKVTVADCAAAAEFFSALAQVKSAAAAK